MVKMNIIEKLGITPEVVFVEGEDGYVVSKCNTKITTACYVTKEKGLVYAAAPEMLEALIDSILMIEEYELSHIYQNGIGTGDKNVIRYHSKIEAIQKATGKSWEEIKILLEADK